MSGDVVIVSRRERRKQRTRDSIIEAARALFVERGFERTTLTEIADRADVAASTLFTHFSSKADVFFADYDRFVDDFIEALATRDVQQESAIDATIRWHREMPLLEREDAPDLSWFSGIRRLIEADPQLLALEQQQYDRALVVLAQEVAKDLGDSELDLRPQLIAAVKAAVLFTQDRFESRLSLIRGETGPSLNDSALTLYVGECLRAAVAAIVQVPVPDIARLPSA